MPNWNGLSPSGRQQDTHRVYCPSGKRDLHDLARLSRSHYRNEWTCKTGNLVMGRWSAHGICNGRCIFADAAWKKISPVLGLRQRRGY
jgi:hypothetical protein